MKAITVSIFFLIFFYGCSQKLELKIPQAPNTLLIQGSYKDLAGWESENYSEVLRVFQESCKSSKTRKLYQRSCEKAPYVSDAKTFLQEEFTPYKIVSDTEQEYGLLTGYYEPFLHASLQKTQKYSYPIYAKPKDLVSVDLSSIYPELKHYRLRGRLEGDKLVPYYTRQKSKELGLNAEVICYTDSKIDRFFLEIQGSGRVLLDDNSTMFIGFSNQNGHKYRAIGKYLVSIGALSLEEVSLQSIRAWLEANPSRLDEVLNYNNSMVFFEQRDQSATGSLGLELTPKRSVAVDRRFIPLGSMLYLEAFSKEQPAQEQGSFKRVVFAQDTGGAIKGSLRADLFLGSGESALDIAGHLKSALKLWILLPNEGRK